MLTRLRVKGFKNLVDTEVRFGPFTCIAGANAVGKSNLFDAIRFLSLLAQGKLDEAGRAIRSEGARNADVRSLFTRVASGKLSPIEMEADMIVPPTAYDELRQQGTASTTFLQYRVKIGYRQDLEDRRRLGELELLEEELKYIPTTQAEARLGFEHSKQWRESVIVGSKRSPLISTTKGEEGKSVITLHMRIKQALQFFPCDVMLVHRDAEKESLEARQQEITEAVASLGSLLANRPLVQIVPVRMSESWMLSSETAIRKASGNPNGKVPLNLPPLSKIEKLPDPKETLSQLLSKASDLPSQRRSTLPLGQMRRLVTQHTDDFSPLRQLSAFKKFEDQIREILF